MPAQHVTIEADGATLAATYTAPDGDGPFPAALIIGGSGPLDRDGNVKRVALNASRDLAALLGEHGWATLRFDKRGVGESTGEYLPTGFGDETADAEAALAWLRERPETATVIAVGHSAGASMAAEFADGRADAAVLLALTAKTGEETLLWQAQEVAKTLPGLARFILRVMRTDVATQQRKALDRIGSSTADVIRMQGAKVNAKWMREFMAYDPMPALQRIAVPVLAITGSKDVQVDPADLETVRTTVPTAEVELIPDVDHILRHEPAPASDVNKYRKQARNPIDARVAGRIVEWLATLPAMGDEGSTS